LGIAIILTAACSDGSKGGAGGAAGGALQAGGQGAGGVTALGGNTGTTVPLTGACASLTCLNPMLALLSNPSCQTSATDTCTQAATMGATIVMNECYSSGVKMQVSMTTDMASMTMTAKRGSSVCYSMEVGGLTGDVMTIGIKNPSGALVGTIGMDSTTSAETVTCPGGSPTVVDATCGSAEGVAPSVPGAGSTATCTTGACTF
jgi:hypothetical protein